MTQLKENLGSIIKIQYALLADVYSISKPNDLNQVNITLIADSQFNEIAFQKESAQFKEESKDTPAGIAFSQSLEFKVMKSNSISTAQYLALVNRPLILLITDGNQIQTVFGEKENPVYIKLSSHRNKKASEPSFLQAKSTLQSKHLAYFYPCEDDQNGGTPGE